MFSGGKITPPDSKKREGDSDSKQASVLESAAMIQGRQKSSKAVHSSSPFGDSVPNHGGSSFHWFPFKAGYQTLGFLRGGTFLGGWLTSHSKRNTPFFFLPLRNTSPGFFAEEDLR